jgi:hypothetical protein
MMKTKSFSLLEFLMVIVVIGLLGFLFLPGCAQVAPQMIKIDEEYHKAILDIAGTRIKYVSCDVCLIDGLGIASPVDFPITTNNDIRAVLQNPGISLALGQIKEIALTTNDETGAPYWKDADCSKCKVLGLGYRAAALGTIDILKLFPQLSPYLLIFGPK